MVFLGELGWGWGGSRVARQIFAVHEQDIGVAVVVVVKEGTARAHGFGKPFFSEGSVVVREVQAGLGGDVFECDVLGWGVRGSQQHGREKKKFQLWHYFEALMDVVLGFLASLTGAAEAAVPAWAVFLWRFR